jgi:hypothetical protein
MTLDPAAHEAVRESEECPAVSAFDGAKFAVVRRFLTSASVDRLQEYALSIAGAGVTWIGDTLVPGSYAAYGDPMMELLLERATPLVESVSRLKLYPTYAYFRVYQRGARLPRHRDRPSCEISVSLNITQDPPQAWPLWILGVDGPAAVELYPGDGVVYRGVDCDHWRDEYSGNRLVQVFLHYVHQDGPYREWRYDKRLNLNNEPK